MTGKRGFVNGNLSCAKRFNALSALSRLEQGFDSRWGRQAFQTLSGRAWLRPVRLGQNRGKAGGGCGRTMARQGGRRALHVRPASHWPWGGNKIRAPFAGAALRAHSRPAAIMPDRPARCESARDRARLTRPDRAPRSAPPTGSARRGQRLVAPARQAGVRRQAPPSPRGRPRARHRTCSRGNARRWPAG